MNDGPASYANDDFGFLRCSNPPELPGTMSGLLEAAIDDARKLDPDTYHPDFERWHSPDKDGTCAICLAGSLIAGTFNASPDKNVLPESFSDDVMRKLNALDCMRLGAWRLAYERFYGHEPALNVSDGLAFLPQPDFKNFNGWDDFRNHLDSLEQAIEPLRRIEADAEPV